MQSAQAPESEVMQLNCEAAELFQIGKYQQAQAIATKALRLAEESLSSDHLDVSVSLTNLGGFYQKQEHYAQAMPLFMRALAIREKVLGPYHPDVAASLNKLALLYQQQGQTAQTAPLFQRAAEIGEFVNRP
jgi:tetratricopeptide (TPR) repeat protein